MFTIAAGPRQSSHSRVRLPRGSGLGAHNHILLFQIRDSKPGGLGPRIYIPQSVAQLYPQALGSLFVTSYDS
jgi:hypothetical protein